MAFGQVVLAAVNRASGRETTNTQRGVVTAALAPKTTTAAVLTAAVLTAGIGVSVLAGGVAEKASQAIDLFKSLGEE